MFSLVSLLIAAALISQQCSFEATARQIEDKKVDLDNSLEPNVVPTTRRRYLSHYVKIEPPPATVRHLTGTTTLLKCGASGFPAPTIVWMRNGELLSDFEEDTNEIQYINPVSLAHLITRLVLTAPSNGDVYTCIATSGGKERTASTTVLTSEGENTADVLEQLFNVPAKPIITAFYENMMQESDTSLILPCRVSSFTEAQVFWTDAKKRPIYDNPRTRVLPSGDLFISKLTWDDMGEFTCIAKNMYGKDSISTFVYPLKPSGAN